MSNPDQTNREKEIFEAALDRAPGEERRRFLEGACGNDTVLLARIEALLRADEAGEDFLSEQPKETKPIITEKPGDQIGPYRLLQQIGEGGCGVVYMAEQEVPVRRRVALKIIKAGMDTKSVIARFEAERQALALMDHINIAKVLEAGATAAGRPYFVMELVGGAKITDYCEQNQLTTRQRLDLFIQVCHAIQHAHQKGIIHRDIKPSNVLVATQDGVAVPKVIDFGIAKATQGRLTDDTVFTAFEQFLGTPAYMSPEQAQLGGLDVDTRSDIYSLGVLLYELLTAKTPFDAKELLAVGLEAMRRTIQEKEPPTPSTRLKQEAAIRSASSNPSAIRSPHFALDRDLDWIVMKCLEKDRGRRYETANGLAMDLHRYANHEPVVARPPTNAYRLQKLVRRHKLAFAAGAAVCASLLIGLSVSTVLFLRERAAREEARQGTQMAQEQAANAKEQEAIARAVNDFLQQDLLRQADSSSQAEARFAPNPNLTVREALERAASRIEDRFKDQPLQEAAVRSSVGLALLGVGQAERATPHLQRALDLRQAKLGPDHPDTLDSMNNLARGYQEAGKVAQALPLFEETIKLRTAKLGPDHLDTLSSMNNLATAYLDTGKLDQALPLLEETLNMRKAKLGPDHPGTLASMNNLARAYLEAGKLDQALPLFEETLKLVKAQLGPDHPHTLSSMNNLAYAYQAAVKLDRALPLFEETLKFRTAKLGPDHPDTLISMNNLARGYQEAGKVSQALALFDETFKLRTAKLGPDHPDTLTSMNDLANAYLVAGKVEQALPLFEETLKLRTAKLGQDHPSTLVSMNNLAYAYQVAGKVDRALPLYEETLKVRKTKLAPDHPEMLRLMNNLANAYRAAGKVDRALPLWEETLRLSKAKLGPDHPDTLTSLQGLAVGYQETGKLDQALPLYEETLKLRTAKLGPDHPSTLVSMNNLGRAYQGADKLDQAIPLLEEAFKLMKAKLGPDHPDTLASMINLASAYRQAGKLNLALALSEEALKLSKAKLGPDHPVTLNSMSGLARAYEAGKFDQALPLYEETLNLQKAKLGPDHPVTLNSMSGLARAYLEAGKIDQALPLYKETLNLQKAKLGPDHPSTLVSMNNLGMAYRAADKLDQALPLLEEAFKLMKAKLGPDHPDTLASMINLASAYRQAGKFDQALPLSEEALKLSKAKLGPDHPVTLKSMSGLGMAYLAVDKPSESEQIARECLGIYEAKFPENWQTFTTKSLLGGSLLAQKKYAEAEPLLLSGYAGMQQRESNIPAAGRLSLREGIERLVGLYDAIGQTNQTAEWKKKLEEYERARTIKRTAEPVLPKTTP